MVTDMFLKAFTLYLFLICDLILSKKVSLPNLNNLGLGSEKLNECRRCKVLTDSFNYWLEKTSRGKFEGGDTAWEETKLKSYARSEIRLVEVQEGLCSELTIHQDYCYALTEEAEQILERWWLKEDPNSVDLHTWLCIETLQYCCSEHHFGHSCILCPLDKNNNVCNGHGKCDGEGTRKGNGTCLCEKGYVGKYCDECAVNFFSASADSCEPCHKACAGCSGSGAIACDQCQDGWQLKSGECVDINECLDSNTCKPNQYCVNSIGSYNCKLCDTSCKTCKGRGHSNCTSCEPPYVLWSGGCLDEIQKQDILITTANRVALYSGLLIIALILLYISKPLTSLIVLIIAVYIYYFESSSEIKVMNVLMNLYE